MEQENQSQEKPAANPPDDIRYEDYVKEYKDACSEFKEMLKEKELMPFSVYDKFLPKMIHDKRYTTVPHRFRRPLFDDLVKNYAVEFHKSKQAEKKVVQDALKSLLDEYEKTGGFLKKPSYKDFKKYFENDKRFAEVLKTFDVEKYFNVKLETFQKTLKDEQAKAKFQFAEMIREYFNEHPDKIDRDLKWKSVKKNFKKDPRYEKIDSSKERESIFQNLIHELARKHREKDRDRERSRSRDRKDKHDKRDRKTSDSARVFKDNEDQSTRLSKLKKMEAIDTYNILLAEKIKTYNIKYRDADDLLRKDPRYSDLNLDRETKEDLFDEYIEKKRQAAISVFKHMLEEKKFELHPNLHFQDVIKTFEEDKRFDLNHKDAKKCFEEFMEHLKDEIYENFEKFLLETPLIHKDSHAEGEEFEHLLERLSKDIRYERMEYRKEKRERMIKARIQVLKEEYEKKHGSHARTDIPGLS